MSGPAEATGVVLASALSFQHPDSGLGVGPVDIAAREGEVIGLLGPNGSGKSTLLRLLATDLAPGAGSLALFGRPAQPPLSGFRRRIAFAPDECFHPTPLSGRENLAFFAQLRGDGGGLPAERDEALEAFGLSADADRAVSGYSFGMRRKLLLAELFLGRKDLLLLDEPAVGLDPQGLDALERAIGTAAGRGAAVIFASNELRRLPLIADRVLLLHEGREVAAGAPTELMARYDGRTRIRIALAEAPPPGLQLELGSVPGVTSLRENGATLELESSAGGAPLPALLARVLDAGAEVRDVQLREPGLEDLFEELTGVELPMGAGS